MGGGRSHDLYMAAFACSWHDSGFYDWIWCWTTDNSHTKNRLPCLCDFLAPRWPRPPQKKTSLPTAKHICITYLAAPEDDSGPRCVLFYSSFGSSSSTLYIYKDVQSICFVHPLHISMIEWCVIFLDEFIQPGIFCCLGMPKYRCSICLCDTFYPVQSRRTQHFLTSPHRLYTYLYSRARRFRTRGAWCEYISLYRASTIAQEMLSVMVIAAGCNNVS